MGQQVGRRPRDLAYYRIAISRVIATESAEETRKYADETRRRMDAFHSVMKAGADLPERFGSRAREISGFIDREGLPGINETLRLAAINSNTEAMNEFLSTVDPAFDTLDSYTTELETVAIRGQGEALNAAHALGAEVGWISGATAFAGIVIANILAWIIVSRVVRQLNRIIGGLDESSNQVASAAFMISESSQSLAEDATEQAASFEETSSALKEMASMTARAPTTPPARRRRRGRR